MRSDSRALHLLQFLLELLDGCMSSLKILVESVSLANEFLFPGTESLLFHLDLLGKSLAEGLFFLLELGVVKLPWSCLAKLASLHLLSTVGLIVCLLGCVNEVEHMCSDQDRSELLEVAVVLILDFSHTPGVLSALDDAAIGGLDVLL